MRVSTSKPTSVARELVRQLGPRPRLIELAAVSLIREVMRGGSSGIRAAQELVDRTDGPVTQRVEMGSTRYVVVVPATIEDSAAWSRKALAWAAEQEERERQEREARTLATDEPERVHGG